MTWTSSPDPFTNPVVKLTLVPVFAALSLATNYAMTSLPNVKLMDALVFIAAFLFGADIGVGTAILSWAVYGFVNPYGPAPFPLILFLMTGECFYAIAGAALSKTSFAKDLRRSTANLWAPNAAHGFQNPYVQSSIAFGIVGLFATFAYDLLTNFATYLFLADSLYHAFVIGIITGAPLAIVHEGSNVVFFSLVAPGVIVASRSMSRGSMEKPVCQ